MTALMLLQEVPSSAIEYTIPISAANSLLADGMIFSSGVTFAACLIFFVIGRRVR